MTPEHWQKVKELLNSALDLEPGERSAFLSKACVSNPELLAEVSSLISASEEAGEFIDRPVEQSALAGGGTANTSSVAGLRIGPYKVLEEIGRGGMGNVYRAVRADDAFRKQVAIKVVRSGMDLDFVLRRFRHERQILATLEHPNIARLLDGGTTGDGLPYVVMEYVDGQPIDQYCDSRKLSPGDRLRLFRVVCGAVHAAHEKLIIHRDIKPGNILVTPDGDPKLLDFGIAKILDPELSTQTIDPTATILRLMTPEYASPEQVRGQPVTAATDVYSLGVLLYELLTGHRPYRLKSRAPHEIAQVICEGQPEKPSTAISRVEEITRGGEMVTLTPEAVSAARHSQPDELRRSLCGDVDNIILMAMRKEPERRYSSARAFSEDIQRHLDGRPVLARRDTLAYRTSKLLRRNRAAAVAALIVAAVMTSMVLAGVWLSHREAAEAGGVPGVTVPFTTYSGEETQPSFSPDGNSIVFVWGGENGENLDIYIKPIDGGSLLRLTSDPAEDVSPAYSPDGKRIAFFRTSKSETAVFLSPAAGGTHGKVADLYPTRIDAVGRHLAWSPDGRYLAVGDKTSAGEPFHITLIEVRTGEKRKLTNPPAYIIGDTSPAFSPDGQSLAFIRAQSSGVNDLYLVALPGGEPRRLTFDNLFLLAETWTPDGRELVFSSNRRGNHSLWRVPAAGGEPRRFSGAGQNVTDPAFSEDGRRLAYSQFYNDANIWRLDLDAPGKAPPKKSKLIVSTQYDSSPQYSPDGGEIAFRSTRSGSNEIWVCKEDGRDCRQITSFGGPLTGTPRWSPDGRSLAFDSRPEGQPDIYTVDLKTGETVRITAGSSEDVVPSWSGDGKWIYFASKRSGVWQVWKAPAQGGAAIQVTQNGGFAAFESPDRKYLYYAKGREVEGLWRVPLGGGEETVVIPGLKAGFWGYWAVTRDGIFFADPEAPNAPARINFFSFATRNVSLIDELEKPIILADSAFAVSPDGSRLLWSQMDQSGSDILLSESP